MNQRIKELAMQAGFELNPAHFDHEKFAELIMKDVCNKLEPVLAKEILQLYGIEE